MGPSGAPSLRQQISGYGSTTPAAGSAGMGIRLPAMLGENGTSRPQAFYGWYVVYAIGFVLMTTSGLAFYNLSVLLDSFVAGRGFPVALTSGATASFFIASGAGGVCAARLMDRIDARLIMIFGACVSAIALR